MVLLGVGVLVLFVSHSIAYAVGRWVRGAAVCYSSYVNGYANGYYDRQRGLKEYDLPRDSQTALETYHLRRFPRMTLTELAGEPAKAGI